MSPKLPLVGAETFEGNLRDATLASFTVKKFCEGMRQMGRNLLRFVLTAALAVVVKKITKPLFAIV